MKRGFVRWFDEELGYGFVAGDDDIDYFVHYTNIQVAGFKSLLQDDEVTFELGDPRPGKSRSQAINVRKVESEADQCLR